MLKEKIFLKISQEENNPPKLKVLAPQFINPNLQFTIH